MLPKRLAGFRRGKRQTAGTSGRPAKREGLHGATVVNPCRMSPFGVNSGDLDPRNKYDSPIYHPHSAWIHRQTLVFELETACVFSTSPVIKILTGFDSEGRNMGREGWF